MKTSRLIVASLVLSLVSGCMGSFVLTRSLYSWNEKFTDSKVINNVVFWALNILPIYSLAVAGDACILNLIEFWTGKNLLADNADNADKSDNDDQSARDDERVAVVENPDGTLSVTRGEERFVLVPQGDDRVDIIRAGVKVGTAERTAVGGVVAFDANGDELGVLTPDELELGQQLAGHSVTARH